MGYCIKRTNLKTGLEGYLMENGRYGHYNNAHIFEGLKAAKDMRDSQEYGYPFNKGHNYIYEIETR